MPLHCPTSHEGGAPPGSGPPSVDDRLVRPETREEMIGGRRLLAMPAAPPHADQHCRLDAEVELHIRAGYVASTDMLTRMDATSDFAADTSVRKHGTDPATGSRYLEELVFEVVHEQPKRDITLRAELLVRRGVRRIFAIFVKLRTVAEWSPEARDFIPLAPDDVIADECLVRPLPVRALLDRQEARDAVARVLLDEQNPVLEGAREAAWSGGFTAGRREAVQRLCEALGVALTPRRRAALDRMTASDLGVLAEQIARERRWD